MLRCRNGFAALRHMVGGAGGIELLRLLIWRGNRPRRSRDGLNFPGRPGFARGRLRVIRLRGVVAGCAATAVASGSPRRRVTRRATSSLPIGPKPGIAPGALKSHEFSDRPTKSRIMGSDDQTRRRAARVKSAGTPAARKALMSDPATIEFDRRQTRRVEQRLSFARRQSSSRGSGGSAATGILRLRSLARIRSRPALAARPPRQKGVVIAHRRSRIADPPRQPCRNTPALSRREPSDMVLGNQQSNSLLRLIRPARIIVA